MYWFFFNNIFFLIKQKLLIWKITKLNRHLFLFFVSKFHTANRIKSVIRNVITEIEQQTCVKFKESLSTKRDPDISPHSVVFTSTESGYVTMHLHVFLITVAWKILVQKQFVFEKLCAGNILRLLVTRACTKSFNKEIRFN